MFQPRAAISLSIRPPNRPLSIRGLSGADGEETVRQTTQLLQLEAERWRMAEVPRRRGPNPRKSAARPQPPISGRQSPRTRQAHARARRPERYRRPRTTPEVSAAGLLPVRALSPHRTSAPGASRRRLPSSAAATRERVSFSRPASWKIVHAPGILIARGPSPCRSAAWLIAAKAKPA